MGSKLTTTYVGGSRFYVAEDDPGIAVPGVTSVLNVIPKDFLRYWYAKMAAELAVDSAAFIVQMAARDPKGAVAYLKGAAQRYSSGRADIGSEAHDLFERMIRGEELGPVSEAMAPYVAHFAEFLRVVQPELISAEDIAYSTTHGYAGSYDAQLTVKVNPETKQLDKQGVPVRLMTDWKTGKATYPDVALQLSAYSYADTIVDTEGNSTPMPEFDGGAVLHITADKWAFKTVKVSEELHRIFLECLRFFTTMRAWEGEGYGRARTPGIKDDVLGKALAKSGRRVTGTERRA